MAIPAINSMPSLHLWVPFCLQVEPCLAMVVSLRMRSFIALSPDNCFSAPPPPPHYFLVNTVKLDFFFFLFCWNKHDTNSGCFPSLVIAWINVVKRLTDSNTQNLVASHSVKWNNTLWSCENLKRKKIKSQTATWTPKQCILPTACHLSERSWLYSEMHEKWQIECLIASGHCMHSSC